jgi:Fe-S-cluster containining protein
VQGKNEPLTKNEQKTKRSIYTDIYLIAPMLKYLGYRKPSYRKVIKDSETRKHHVYTCKHYDPKKKCTIYEYRPQMCRDYPYGNDCNYAACTWKERKQKRETPKERKNRLALKTDPGGKLKGKKECDKEKA